MNKIIYALVFILFLNTVPCYSKFKVKRVIDGDTFILDSGERVRLVGINSPDLKDVFGLESKKYLSELIEGKEVDLISDTISSNSDIYKRLLRYVYINNVDINHKMIYDGYAFAFLKHKFQKESNYKEAQIIARNNSSGIWGKSKDFIQIDSLGENVSKDTTNIENRAYLKCKKAWIIGSIILILVVILIYYSIKK